MSNTTKKCPLCAETIPVASATCQFCGAQFEVTSSGYCTNCHAVRDTNKTGHCLDCGNAVTDWRVESRFVDTQASPPVPPPAAPAPPPIHPVEPLIRSAPPVPPKKNAWIGWAIGGLFVFGLLAIVVVLVVQNGLHLPGIPALATPTRTLQPTATSIYAATQQGFTQPILDEISDHQPNFEDDFSALAGVFERWFGTTPGVTFGDGVMHLNTTDWSAGGGPLVAKNFVLKYEFTPVIIGSGSAVCSYLRYSNVGGYKYCVDLSDDWWKMGSFLLNGAYYPLIEGGSNGVSAYHTTRITIIARGDEFAVSIDDRFVGYAQDDFHEKYIGDWANIVVYTTNDETAVDVDNVQFWDLDNLKP